MPARFHLRWMLASMHGAFGVHVARIHAQSVTNRGGEFNASPRRDTAFMLRCSSLGQGTESGETFAMLLRARAPRFSLVFSLRPGTAPDPRSAPRAEGVPRILILLRTCRP